MPILGLRLFVHLWRCKGECRKCKKVRAERISFIAEESPHLTHDFAFWIGRLCEIATVSRVAELLNQDETTTWRMDLARMQVRPPGLSVESARQLLQIQSHVIKSLKRRVLT